MILSVLLNGIEGLTTIGKIDLKIEGIAFDSRKVGQGFLFAALPGTTVDGHQFIQIAIEKGAIAILCEHLPVQKVEGITWIQCSNSSKVLGQIASIYYGNPSEKMKVVGITGQMARLLLQHYCTDYSENLVIKLV